MRFIATADWQLGMTAHYFDDEARPRYREARFEAIRQLGKISLERQAEFVVVCGDVFESNQLDRRILWKTFDVLREISCPVFMLPGNHDHLGPGSIYDSPQFQAPENVTIIRDSTPIPIDSKFEIVGVPWYSKTPTSDILNDVLEHLPNPAPDVFRLVCGHGGASSLSANDDPAVIDVDRLAKNISDGKASFVALGDRHSTTELLPSAWYPGTPEVTSRKEEDPGNVLLVDTSSLTNSCTIEVIPTGNWVFSNLLAELNSDDDVTHFLSDLENMPNKANSAIWFAAQGALSTESKARLDSEISSLATLFALLEPWERHTDLTITPQDGDFTAMDLSGFARDALEELIEIAQSDQQQSAIAADALGLLFRFSGVTQ